MLADEIMLKQMQSETYIDSIRLMTCKYRILHAHSDWLVNFCRSGGEESCLLSVSTTLRSQESQFSRTTWIAS
jgi:hypothetical protein